MIGMESDRVNVGAIGAGGIAEQHIQVLSTFDDVVVTAISNRGGERGRCLAAKYDVEGYYDNYEAMLDKESIDAVFVLPSVMSVYQVATECLSRGIPSLIEKPPGISSTETASMLSTADATGCLNMVGVNRRFYSVMRQAKQAIDDVGGLCSIVVEAPERFRQLEGLLDFHPREVLENWIVCNGMHCIDLLRFFGGDVLEIAVDAVRGGLSKPSQFNALIRFEGGATGHYISNWTAPGRWSVVLYGDGRRVTLEPLEEGTIWDVGEAERSIEPDTADVTHKPGFHAQDRFFIDCVKSGTLPDYPASNLADSLKTMQLIEQIVRGDRHVKPMRAVDREG